MIKNISKIILWLVWFSAGLDFLIWLAPRGSIYLAPVFVLSVFLWLIGVFAIPFIGLE